ncbi:MAG: C45 family peptidase [bacterium]
MTYSALHFMIHKFKTFSAALFSIAFFVSAIAVADVAATYNSGRLEMVEGVRVVYLSGTPHEIGVQHGALLKKEINFLIKYFFEERGNIFGATPDALATAAKILERHIPEEYVEEMRGIAEGAGVGYEKILYSNIFLDVVSADWVGVKPNCSNFAVLGGVTRNGDVIHGRNLDWSSDKLLVLANTVFFITPAEGVPLASVSWPGMAGTLTGINAEQISMGEMTSITSDASLDGMPFMIHLRKLLQYSTNLDDAYSILSKLPRTTGYNVLVTDGKANDGFVAELSATRITRSAPRNGVLIHTNHFLHEEMAPQQEEIVKSNGGRKTDSQYRYERLEHLIDANVGGIDEKSAEEFLSDKFNPEEGKISENLSNTICKGNTLQSVVMLPQSGELYVALKTLPAPDGGYVKLKLQLNTAGKK